MACIPKKSKCNKKKVGLILCPEVPHSPCQRPSTPAPPRPRLTSGLLTPGRPLSLLSSSQAFSAFPSHFEGRGFLVHIYSMNSPFRGPPGHRAFVSPSQLPSPSCEGLSPPLAASLLASDLRRAETQSCLPALTQVGSCLIHLMTFK